MAENLRVATYTMTGGGADGRERALELFPELEKRLTPARSLSGGGSRWSCSRRRSFPTPGS